MPTYAETLKAEGNALFARSEFADACNKYSHAIEHDGENAILYSNRAACMTHMGRLQAALKDAKKATELDPTYVKGWSRLAIVNAHLQKHDECIAAWRRAHAAFPVENLTAAQVKQRDQIASELAAATTKAEHYKLAARRGISLLKTGLGNLPWERAAKLKEQETVPSDEQRTRPVILAAHKEFMEGIEIMSHYKERPARRGGNEISGKVGALERLSNAVIMDSRVFFVHESFPTLYNKQVRMELEGLKGWSDDDVEQVIREAPLRLAAEKWQVLRPALSVTVRSWIMRGIIDYELRDKVVEAVDAYDRALEVMQWGKRHWTGVPVHERGAVFEDTFIRGVQCLRMEAYKTGCFSTNPAERAKFDLDTLYGYAQELLEEIKTHNLPVELRGLDRGQIMAFYLLPMAKANAMIGFYHAQKAEAEPWDDVVHYDEAAKAYHLAADIFPADDENRIWALHGFARAFGSRGATAGDVLDAFDRIRDAIPRMRELWEFSSAISRGRDQGIQSDLYIREELLKSFDNDEVDEDTIIRPAIPPGHESSLWQY